MKRPQKINRKSAQPWIYLLLVCAVAMACGKEGSHEDPLPNGNLEIVSFVPDRGAPGTTITIRGTGFAPAKDLNSVTFNGLPATVTASAANGAELTVTVPANATTGKIAVTVNNRSATSTTDFTVPPAPRNAIWSETRIDLFPGETAYDKGLYFVYRNKIYWGFNSFANPAESDCFVFDPARPVDGWMFVGHPPVDIAPIDLQFANAIVHNNRVYIGTGLAGPARNAWYEYFPETNTSNRLTDFPAAVSGAVSFVLGNTIYVGFGSTNKNLYTFNPAGNNNLGSWTLATTAGFSELNSGNAMVLNNEVFLGRALPAPLQSRNAIYKFTAPNTITRVTDMPDDVSTFQTPSFTLDGKGYFVVGNQVWEYTPNAGGGAWRATITAANIPSIKQVATVTLNGAQVVYGWTASGALYEFTFL